MTDLTPVPPKDYKLNEFQERYPGQGILEHGRAKFFKAIQEPETCNSCGRVKLPDEPVMPDETLRKYLEEVVKKGIWELKALTGESEDKVKQLMIRELMDIPDPKVEQALQKKAEVTQQEYRSQGYRGGA